MGKKLPYGGKVKKQQNGAMHYKEGAKRLMCVGVGVCGRGAVSIV